MLTSVYNERIWRKSLELSKGAVQTHCVAYIDLLTVIYDWLQLTGGIDDRACCLLMTRLKMMILVAAYG